MGLSGAKPINRPPRGEAHDGFGFAQPILRGKRRDMIKVLKEAIDQVTGLPEADQEQIGRELLEHALKIRALRADLQAGIDSLDAGRGKELDIGDVIKRARARYAKP
jgi:hypothetical protein